MLKVYKECCGNCLLSENRIVSPRRAKEIIQGCIKKQTHFQCHKSTIEGKDILCKTFYDRLGHHSQMVRIAERFNAIEFVDLPNNHKATTYNEIHSK